MGGSTLVNSASDRVIADAARIPHTQHEFYLSSSTQAGGSSAPWAILRTFSRPTMITPRYPRFYGGDHVKGEVLLNPNYSQRVVSIDILLRGTIKPGVGGGESYCFLEYPHHVWSGAASTEGTSRPPGGAKKSDNMAFVFSFPFPASVEYGAPLGRPRQHNRTLHRIPQTTFDIDASIRVEYDLVARFTHRTSDVRLTSPSEIKSKILFIPDITPDPPSLMRQQAYSRNAPLPSPDIDPQGWVALPSLSVVGFSKHHHKIKLNYALHLASPLSYTRGTSLPCYLWISGEDAQSVDSIATSELLYMRLVRQTRFFENPAKGTEQYLNNQQPRVLEEVQEVGRATWWYPSAVQQERCFRKLEGEIYLAEDLEPSSSFVPLSVKYKVELLPFNHLNKHLFRHSETGSNQQGPNIMLSQSITIATVAADGPPQRTSSQPRRSSPRFSEQGQGPGAGVHHDLERVRDWVRSHEN